MDQIADNLNQFNKMKRTTSFVPQVFVVKVTNYLENEGIHAVNVEGACKHGAMKVLK